MHCCLCKQETVEPQRHAVRCNLRRFADERFDVWQCSGCGSVHAADEVDLDHYYAHYPFHDDGHIHGDASDDASGDPGTDGHGSNKRVFDIMYTNLLGRLQRAGLTRACRVLDYGCGSGAFLSFMRERGFEDCVGYDQYNPAFDDARVLESGYDWVMTQDVIEHVADPAALAARLHGLARPGGLIVIGTPDGGTIDLNHSEERIHSLHQPYHRHILSERALVEIASGLGWEQVALYHSQYTHTSLPFCNSLFGEHYMRCFDNNLDLAFQPLSPWAWRLWTPKALMLGLFGGFFTPKHDLMGIWRRPS